MTLKKCSKNFEKNYQESAKFSKKKLTDILQIVIKYSEKRKRKFRKIYPKFS